MVKDDLIKRIDQLLIQGQNVLSTKKSADLIPDYVDKGLLKGFRAKSLSFIKYLYGESHPYFKQFDECLKGQAYY